MKNERIKNLTITALFVALVVIGSKIYIGTHDTFRVHLGNSMCLLAAFILNPIYAGIASGTGSMIFDILFYPQGGILVTFLTKFAMTYVASFIFHKLYKTSKKISILLILSGTIGEICYVILYAIKTYIERRYILSMAKEVVIPIVLTKVSTSIVNAIIAVIISTILYNLIEKTHKI